MDEDLYNAARRRQDTDIPRNIDARHFQVLTPDVLNNALHVAAQYGNTEFITKTLARVGREHRYYHLCQPNSKGEIPLHLAAEFGHKETVEALIIAHSEDAVAVAGRLPIGNHMKPCWSERDNNGDTPLHKALRYGYKDIAKLLLSKDENMQLVSIDNRVGESPAYLAAESFCKMFLVDIVEKDRDGQCSISFSGPFGQTVFHAARRLTTDIMNSLIKIGRGALLKAQDNKGKTVLHYAAEEGRHHIVETLLKAESSLAYLRDNDGLTPLHTASKKGLLKVVSTILELCPQSAEIRDNHGKTVLHVVAVMNDAYFLSQCLENTEIKMLINQVDDEGNTPLHLAFINSEYDAALQLLKFNGCNGRLRNNEGYSPLDLCISDDKIPYKYIYFTIGSLESGKLQAWKRHLPRFSFERMGEMELRKSLNEISVAAALLLPVNFSATLNVPGGYDKSTGKPILINLLSVKLFIFTSVISFMATASILIFRAFGPGNDFHMKIRRAILSMLLLQLALGTTVLAYISGALLILDASNGYAYASLIVIFLCIVIEFVLVSRSSFATQFVEQQEGLRFGNNVDFEEGFMQPRV